MSPNFLIAGGVATGTSFLSKTLSSHPEIYLPRIQRPEPNFFHYSWKFNQGIEWYKKTWFHEVSSHKAIGERSSLLLPSPMAARRIKQFFPSIKLIFCLRNPIERAWANYRFTVLEGLEPLPFDEALASESHRMRKAEGMWAEVQPHAYIHRSLYSTCLNEYIQLFGRKNILLLKSETLKQDTARQLKRVCEFLDVDTSFLFSPSAEYSSPSVLDRETQITLRSYFGDRFPSLVECIRKNENFSHFIQSEKDEQCIGQLRKNLTEKKDPLPPHFREKMFCLFEKEIKALGKMLDFSIDDWM